MLLRQSPGNSSGNSFEAKINANNGGKTFNKLCVSDINNLNGTEEQKKVLLEKLIELQVL